MIEVFYTNRYGDVIVFSEQEDGTIHMTGGSYWRVGWNDKQENTMVDPSGGPYIGLGYDMGFLHSNWTGRIIRNITFQPGTAIFSF